MQILLHDISIFTKDIHRLDMIQRSAARLCFHNYLKEPGIVTNMLSNKLEWLSLEGRPIVSRLSMFHGIVYRAVDMERDLYLTSLHRSSKVMFHGIVYRTVIWLTVCAKKLGRKRFLALDPCSNSDYSNQQIRFQYSSFPSEKMGQLRAYKCLDIAIIIGTNLLQTDKINDVFFCTLKYQKYLVLL